MRSPRRGDQPGRVLSVWWLLVPLALLVVGVLIVALASGGSTPASGPVAVATSPVDLSTPVDMAAGTAHPSAVVRSGDARIEVLTPTLLRLEYSPTAHFEDAPTVNVVDRSLPVPRFTTAVSGGWLTVRTSRATLRYRIGSGPFRADNTTLRLEVAGHLDTVAPTWEWECPFGQVCQAGAAATVGGAQLSQSEAGYDSTAGYVGYLNDQGAGATWTILGAPGGPAALAVRYSDPAASTSSGPGRIGIVVNGRLRTVLSVPRTTAASPWSTVTTTAVLRAGTNSVEAVSQSGQRAGLSLSTLSDNFNLGIDTLSIGPGRAPVPVPVPAATDPLGGWIRGFDTYTYGPGTACPAGTAGATCLTAIEPLHTDGLLDRAGWRLLDDTQSATWSPGGWVQPRTPDGDVEDGYLFAYGHDYTGALHTLAQLTGPAPLLPRSVFGVWYSDYTPYSSHDIEDSVYPAFQRNDVPLDTLSLDTDWKAPNNWNGWEWNSTLFPDPSAFLTWARSRGVAVTLNIHSSIQDNDPKLPAAQRIAQDRLAPSTCSAGPCKVWDWSVIDQAESNFALQQRFQKQGVSFWWLDWCCDDSTVTMPGLTPDSWIDHLYAQEMVNQNQRGFVLARIGSSNADPEQVYPAGPWSDHTTGIAFTGDAWGTWNTLATEAALTPDEATIGEPYVSDDIGSYLGPPPSQTGADPPDLYDRWVQLGTFQPILRLHSNNEDRLPWQYPEPVRTITEQFLRLREALVPYSYTLADQAHRTGLPMTLPLYLDYPDQAAAYAHADEYLYGSDMLVAPVTSPGAVADTTLWIPPGRWVDYFTGATFSGPGTVTVSDPLSRMPVFVRAGGIIPEQAVSGTSTAGPAIAAGSASSPLTLNVYAGAGGSFSLYRDRGTGLGYTRGQSSQTPVTASDRGSQVTIGPAQGTYPGAPAAVRYRLDLVDLSRPSTVTIDGHHLEPHPSGSAGPGWYYQPDTSTVVISTPALSTARTVTVSARGGRPVNRTEPATASS